MVVWKWYQLRHSVTLMYVCSFLLMVRLGCIKRHTVMCIAPENYNWNNNIRYEMPKSVCMLVRLSNYASTPYIQLIINPCPVWDSYKFHFILNHDDVIKWKHFPRNWPFVRGIHRSPMNSPHKGQWRGAFMFSLICVWINDWENNREAGD